jgi:UDP-glucose 4-epimerase
MRALVTGGAGFIGSHLVDALIKEGGNVIVVDDLSTGSRANLNAEAEFFEGSVADPDVVARAIDGCDVVFHQAALGSVPRSLERPLDTNAANLTGTLTVLQAARQAGIRRFVWASSSSVYGGAKELPTPETAPLAPRSPYGVSKLAAEHYCRVFWELFQLETVGLRYFNVYGPRQAADSEYAAVIPRFITALLTGGRPTVHGDGLQTRDFTYVSDVVNANLLAARAPADRSAGRAYNIAGGAQWTLIQMLEIMGDALSAPVNPEHTPPRSGDIRHSMADARAAARDLRWEAKVEFPVGIRRTVEWFAGDSAGPPLRVR